MFQYYESIAVARTFVLAQISAMDDFVWDTSSQTELRVGFL